MLDTLYKISEVYFPLLGTNGFHVKASNESRIYCCEHALSSESQIRKFHAVVWQTTSKICTKKRAAHAARLFFLIQSIKLICGVAVAVAIADVIS